MIADWGSGDLYKESYYISRHKAGKEITTQIIIIIGWFQYYYPNASYQY